MPEFVGALDWGTTSTRFMIFDHDGTEVAKSQLEHHVSSCPRPGWVEHDPGEIWRHTNMVIADALEQSHLEHAGSRRYRSYQSARDVGHLASSHWRATRRRDRLAGHPNRGSDRDIAEASGVRVNSLRQRTGLPLSTYSSAEQAGVTS